MTNPSWLKSAAQCSEQEVWTLGHTFKRYCGLEERTPEELAAELGCSLEVLHWLSLCRCPEGEKLTLHVSVISERFAVDSQRLIAVLRRVEVMNALSARSENAEVTDEEALLLAARDRPHDEETSS